MLAADESTGTMGNRLAKIGLENVEENRYEKNEEEIYRRIKMTFDFSR